MQYKIAYVHIKCFKRSASKISVLLPLIRSRDLVRGTMQIAIPIRMELRWKVSFARPVRDTS